MSRRPTRGKNGVYVECPGCGWATARVYKQEREHGFGTCRHCPMQAMVRGEQRTLETLRLERAAAEMRKGRA